MPNTQPDPTQTGSSPSSGFWGVIKNKVLPNIGPAANKLAMLYGSPAVRQGAQAGIETDIAQKEEAQRQALAPYQLAEAAGKAQMIPSEIQSAQAGATSATKKAALEPGSLPELQKQDEIHANAGLTGLMDLASKSQPQVPDVLPGVTPPSGSGATIPPPQELVANQIAKLWDKPTVDKEQTEIMDANGKPTGRWSFKERNRQLQVVGEQPAAGPPARMSTPRNLLPYMPNADPDVANAAQLQSQSTSTSTTPVILKDAQGNEQAVDKTSTTSRQSRGTPPAANLNPGKKAPLKPRAGVSSATPVLDSTGQQIHQPISQSAKTTLSQIYSSQNFIGDSKDPKSLISQLSQMKDKGSLWDAAKQRIAWQEYTKAGVVPSNIDPLMAQLLPTISQLQILGGQAYLRGIRNFNFISQIQQHLPDPSKDAPQLMVQKMQNLSENLPKLIDAIYKSEGVGQAPPAAPGSAPGGGASSAASGGPRPPGW